VHESGDAIELYLPNLRAVVGRIAARFFHYPSEEMKVIGVTGTNGKTSVTHYIAQLLNLNEMKTAVIGTLGVGVPFGQPALESQERTTPNVIDVHRNLAKLRDAGVACVAMEVSSHGLDQGRVDQVRFEGAVFTNLSRDHLDYHETMEAYGAAKAKLFKWPSLAFSVLNKDDPFSETLREVIGSKSNVLDYGVEDANVQRHGCFASDTDFSKGVSAQIRTPAGVFALVSPLMGRFNLDNLLATIGVAYHLGISPAGLEKASQVQAVQGRMQVLQHEDSPKVIIDYAHTPDALENLMKAVKPYCNGQIYLMFGCGGDRDAGKRPQMAQIAQRYSDHIVLTDDNPRYEDPEQIVQDILAGFSPAEEVEVIHSRAEAIAHLIDHAGVADVIVLAGKGHESYQELRGEKLGFSDIEVAQTALDQRRKQNRAATHD